VVAQELTAVVDRNDEGLLAVRQRCVDRPNAVATTAAATTTVFIQRRGGGGCVVRQHILRPVLLVQTAAVAGAIAQLAAVVGTPPRLACFRVENCCTEQDQTAGQDRG